MKDGYSVDIKAFHYAAILSLVQLAACSDKAAETPATGEPPAANAQPAPPAPEEGQGKLIVAFGDSLYAGYGLDQDKGFAPVLERALNAQGAAVRVHNAGVSGDTTAAGLQRLAFTLDGLGRKPDLVILGLGANDMLRGLPVTDTRANLDAMLGELKRRGIDVVLTGMVAAPNMGADYAASFNAIYPDLAKKYQVPLYPFFLDGVAAQRTLLLPDGMHPNDRGIETIVARVAPTIAAAVKD